MRTCGKSPGNTRLLLSRGAKSGAHIEVFENTGLSNPHMADPDLAFIIDAWSLLGPQAKIQMMAMARDKGKER